MNRLYDYLYRNIFLKIYQKKAIRIKLSKVAGYKDNLQNLMYIVAMKSYKTGNNLEVPQLVN